MRLAALVESLDHVCCRYRLRAFEPHFLTAGHSFDWHTFPRGWFARFGIGKQLCQHDLVIVQRKLLSTLELRLLRRRVSSLLFDFDDAVWMRDSYSKRGFTSRRRHARFQAMMSACQHVVAGNTFLADAAREAGATSISVIPTCVEVRDYPIAKHDRPSSSTELVWIGSSSTLQGIEAIQSILQAVARRLPHLAIKIICDRFLTIPGVTVHSCPWSAASEKAELAAAEIGISWVPDDPWSRGKCGLKLLQYMAAGLPVVTNPVGVHSEMVRHGENGFLVKSEAEWVEAIDTLAHDAELRRRMGAAGRRLVEQCYSVEAGAQLWLEFFANFEEQRVSA